MAKAKSKEVSIHSLPLQERVDMLVKVINDAQQQMGVGIVPTLKYGKVNIIPEIMFNDLLKKDEATEDVPKV